MVNKIRPYTAPVMPAITYMLLRLLSKLWPIGSTSLAVVVKEKSL